MKRFLLLSVSAHAAAAIATLVWWWWPAPSPDEVPATVEVIFGSNGHGGLPVPNPTAPPADADPSPGESPDNGAATRPPAPPLPVRLGDADAGLRVDEPPDSQMVEAQADPGNNAPVYPEEAHRRHEHGRVVVRMHIDTQGRVSRTEIVESSGHPLLDEAARRGLEKWHFIPALRDGVAVPSYRDQAADFVLE